MNIDNTQKILETLPHCRLKGEYCKFSEVRHDDLYCNHEKGPAGILFHIIGKEQNMDLLVGSSCPLPRKESI